jgi:hypothetical protein
LAGPYSMSLSQSVTRESNLLRVEEGQAVPDTLSRSDTVWTSTLQGGIDQPIGRQRVFGNASLRHSRFGEQPGVRQQRLPSCPQGPRGPRSSGFRARWA